MIQLAGYLLVITIGLYLAFGAAVALSGWVDLFTRTTEDEGDE